MARDLRKEINEKLEDPILVTLFSCTPLYDNPILQC